MDSVVKDPHEIWEKRLNSVFEKKKKTDVDRFLDIVSIIVYLNDTCKDVADLYSIVDLDTFIKLISLFDGRTITFPTKEEIQESIELALFYYYKNIKGIKDYKDLKGLNIIDSKDFSSISIGKKLIKLDKKLNERIMQLFLEMDNE